MARTILLSVLATLFMMGISAFDVDPRVTTVDNADSVDCDGTLRSLLSCLPAVEGDDPEPPSSDCCSAVVNVNTDCLCNAIGQGDAESFPGMNVNAALQLPRECGRVVPKGFKCAGWFLSPLVFRIWRCLLSLLQRTYFAIFRFRSFLLMRLVVLRILYLPSTLVVHIVELPSVHADKQGMNAPC
ncbi:hypothetical protein R1flu_014936 [Riccia fluitans]|uniref:Bifunctional inhibitor/plant lipid transfer protein/seed storage helical domain-containing protein n=1 Tax=Riccia fluitans TaxID=41844 RepID=A0ABD1YID3_9MARC